MIDSPFSQYVLTDYQPQLIEKDLLDKIKDLELENKLLKEQLNGKIYDI